MIKSHSRRKLTRTSSHRRALLRNMSVALIINEKLKTTNAKAKELRSFVEKLITVAKKGRETSYRRIEQDIKSNDAMKKLFDVIAPRYSERNGGYTQIFKLGYRKGDAAPMSMLKLIQ